ncbi:MAG: hypothetical protein ACI9JM_002133 [Halioglobus sp.]|jgi:hypothetical protein
MAYKIIQWSSGNVGKSAIRTVAQRKDLKLVGLFVYDPKKVGMDAGEIAGIKRLGVKASNDKDNLLEMDADCVIHTPLPSLVYGDKLNEDLDTVCALLSSGKNVITTVGYMYPKVHGAKVMNRLKRACRKGGSSFHGTGANPGWLGDVLPLMISGISQSIDKIHVQEITNFEFYPSPEVVFDMMGFGRTPKQFKLQAARYTSWLSGLFKESIQMVADGLELKLDSISEQSKIELTKQDITVAAGTLKKGTIAGQRWEWAGVVNKKKIIVHETIWRMHDCVGDKWPRGNHSITIKGKPDMYFDFGPDWNNDVLLSTAAHAANAVPYVCDAPCGIQTFLDLPTIIARGSASHAR